MFDHAVHIDEWYQEIPTGLAALGMTGKVYEHKNHLDKNSFTSKYNVTRLVYFEETSDVRAAIEREKQIKSWSRDKKTDLIFRANPHWVDLYNQILG